MSAPNRSSLVLSFEPNALERCYAVADVLDEVYDRPHVEYAMIALAPRFRSSHVVATPLLAGQDVSAGGVYQSGHNVLSMRREIDALSNRMGFPLVLRAFVHRHPLGCHPSSIDNEFLASVFVDQVSTVVSFREARRVTAGGPHHACLDGAAKLHRRYTDRARDVTVEVEFSTAFSLIVNKERDNYIYAVRKERCQFCSEDRVRFVPAELAVFPDRALSQEEHNQIREELESEVAAKIRFDGSPMYWGVDQ